MAQLKNLLVTLNNFNLSLPNLKDESGLNLNSGDMIIQYRYSRVQSLEKMRYFILIQVITVSLSVLFVNWRRLF